MGSTDPSPSFRLRRDLRDGDAEAIVALHERVYSQEHGLDRSFVDHVRSGLEHALERGWPGRREGVGLVEDETGLAGSFALTDEGAGEAALRWIVLERRLRGCGLGRSLVTELVEKARRDGFHTIRLETFSELEAAAGIYRGLGFEPISAETGPRWGRDSLTFQRYELRLASGRSEPAPRADGRPFEARAQI